MLSLLRTVPRAYAPYSRFQVGAAVLAESVKMYGGANVENASYPAGICAERNAIAHAVASGERRLAAIAICGGNEGSITGYCAPCGICRQFLSEFCGEDTPIYIGVSDTDYEEHTLGKLLPLAFHLD